MCSMLLMLVVLLLRRTTNTWGRTCSVGESGGAAAVGLSGGRGDDWVIVVARALIAQR